MYNNMCSPIPTVIIAGGQSRRLQLGGQPKWQLPFGKQTLLNYIISQLEKQTSKIAINAPYSPAIPLNREDLDLIYDIYPNFCGPLAGLHSALSWAQEHGYDWVATTPCDSPFFPPNLLQQLTKATQTTQHLAAIARCSNQVHPVFGLWSTELLAPLAEYIAEEDRSRSLYKWALAYAHIVDFPLRDTSTVLIDPFLNINTPEDYQLALQQLGHI
jgi:molybdopterin-guanine dinucleotide biosynthesis protein A